MSLKLFLCNFQPIIGDFISTEFIPHTFKLNSTLEIYMLFFLFWFLGRIWRFYGST